MSGVNGAAVAGAILPCLIYLLTRAKGPRRTLLLRWWSAAVVLGTFWWAASLALLAKYGFPFLPFTESASVTTATTSLTRVLRGASHWVAFLTVDGQSWWRAGWAVATGPLVIVATAMIAGFGLAGLARRDLAERRFLGYCAIVGVAILCSGFAAELGAPGAEFVRIALDGPLAPLRNLHKFDPGLRLAVALGVAHLLAVWRLRQIQAAKPTIWTDLRPAMARIVTAGALVLVVGSAGMAGLPSQGSIEKLPDYWRQTAAWLDRNAGDSSTLLVPGSNFGEYAWGRTMDEPIQPLLNSRWAVRALVPGGSTGNARLLAAIDERLAAGAASPGLPQMLSRLGVRYLVVRNDLSRPLSGVAWPILVHRTIDGTAGLSKVARCPVRQPPLARDGLRAGP
jgi:arabinofuranan 3-O-arabinosyltransferase